MERSERRAEILEQNGFHFLWINKGNGPELCMWDLPDEIEYQREVAAQAHGDVLVAGYGFGLVQKFLFENPKVTSVTTVEILPEVVEQCRRVFGKVHGNVVIGDFYKFGDEKVFDTVIGDIWIEPTKKYLEEYVKFKEKGTSLLKPGGKVLAWGSDYFEFLIRQNWGG